MFNITYCGKSSTNSNFGKLEVAERPSIPSPIKRVETVRVPGRSGYLHFTDNTYDGIDINIKFNFRVNAESDFPLVIRMIKAWIYTENDDKRLVLSNIPQEFYSVVYAEMSEVECSRLVGKFNVTFHCEPYRYIESSFVETNLNRPTAYYGAAEIFPLYKINMPTSHNGYIALEGKPGVSFESESPQIIIDTKLGIAYAPNGFVEIDGDIRDLTLGMNDVISGAIRVEIDTDCTGTRIDRGGWL